MNRDIFYNASLKLTSLYLIIIMTISLIFSVGFYRVSANELERGIRKPPASLAQIIKNRDIELLQRIKNEQDTSVDLAQSRLQASLLLINLFIFVGGGLLSYYLARRTLKPIEEMHEAQSRFTADASHELRTPIAAMRLENEIALSDNDLSLKEAKELLNSNIEELDKLTALSEGLLQLARLDKDSLDKNDVKVKSLIKDATKRVESTANLKKQKIISKVTDKGVIYVNEASVIEALVTVLDNAIKYSPNKSDIIITVKRSKHSVDFSIEDKGIGILPIDQQRIFDRFYRADLSRNKDNIEGYGIGLSIAKSVVEAHGGSISVKSEPKKGSKFTLSFPVK